MNVLKRIFALPLYLQTLIAMIAGVIAGLIWGTKMASYGVLAQMIVTLIKAFATPLLFITIFESILDSQFKGSGIRKMLVISFINALAAMAIGLILINTLHPGQWLSSIVADASHGDTAKISKTMSWGDALQTLIPESIVQPFVTNQIPAVILVAVLLAIALKSVLKDDKATLNKIKASSRIGLDVILLIFKYILTLIPLAVFAAVAKAVGLQGMQVFKGLSVYLLVCCGGMLLHIAIVYQAWIRFYAGRSLIIFWSKVKTPVLYAFGINSSLASLPLTLKTLDQLKVTPSSARLSACLGTNFNNDGILLYQVVAVLMIAQALGLNLGLSEQINLACLSLVATLGVAGIPEAGVIALTILMTTANLPLQVIPLLLSVDWLVARLRSVTNVLGDITVAIAIDGRRQAS